MVLDKTREIVLFCLTVNKWLASLWTHFVRQFVYARYLEEFPKTHDFSHGIKI